MSSSLPHRIAAIMLSQLKAEKEARFAQENEQAQHQLEEDMLEAERKNRDVAEEKHKLETQLRKEHEELQRLRETIEREAAQAAEEQAIFDLRKRIEDFRGNDNEAVRERLRAEGFQEKLIIELVRMRTLDERVERETAQHARFEAEDRERKPLLDSITQSHDMYHKQEEREKPWESSLYKSMDEQRDLYRERTSVYERQEEQRRTFESMKDEFDINKSVYGGKR